MPHFSPGLPKIFMQKFAGLPVAERQFPVASVNHCISCSPVLTSGPAIYFLGVKGRIARAKLSTKAFLSFASPPFQMMPALAPPNGIPAKAFFQVIVRAKRNTSSSDTFGVIRMPPLPGPSTVLSITKNPAMPILGSYTFTIYSGPNVSFMALCLLENYFFQHFPWRPFVQFVFPYIESAARLVVVSNLSGHWINILSVYEYLRRAGKMAFPCFRIIRYCDFFDLG